MTPVTVKRTPSSQGDLCKERGLLSTELAVLMPIMLLIAVLAVYVVQVERHGSRAQQAADAAARAASLTRSEADAYAAALDAAEAVCEGAVQIDAAGFDYVEPDLGSFTPGRVAVQVSCTEQYSGFAPLVPDGARNEWGYAAAAIEYWRGGS